MLHECIYFLYLPVYALDRVSMLMAEDRSFSHSRQGLNQSALYSGFHLLKVAVCWRQLSCVVLCHGFPFSPNPIFDSHLWFVIGARIRIAQALVAIRCGFCCLCFLQLLWLCKLTLILRSLRVFSLSWLGSVFKLAGKQAHFLGALIDKLRSCLSKLHIDPTLHANCTLLSLNVRK